MDTGRTGNWAEGGRPVSRRRGVCIFDGSEFISQESCMTIADKAVLVTGANRGIGQALVEEALRRGAKRVYAGTRQSLAHLDERVTPVTLDVTNAAQIQGAVERVDSLDILINNAGLAFFDDFSR